jgi:transcriptional coactivator p15 (PC4)
MTRIDWSAPVPVDRFGGEPLADDGVKLATINRGPNCELRIRWKTFKGFPYLDVREWTVNKDNAQWFPTKGKGITVKPRELSDVIAALTNALALIEAGSRA